MRHSVEEYAQALAAVVGKKDVSSQHEKVFAKNFVALLKKNGDLTHAGKICARTESLMRRTRGDRKLTIMSARALSGLGKTLLKQISHFADIVEERTQPDLVAGVRIIINDEEQFDASLKRKLDLLFS